jgi:hypothetical protein
MLQRMLLKRVLDEMQRMENATKKRSNGKMGYSYNFNHVIKQKDVWNATKRRRTPVFSF